MKTIVGLFAAAALVGLATPAAAQPPGSYRDRPVWLGEEAADSSEFQSLLTPFPSEQMTCWPVSARVGNVKNNDPGLIEPIAA